MLTAMRVLSLVALVSILGVAHGFSAPRSLVPEGWREVATSRSEGGERVFISPDEEARLRLGHIIARRGNRRRDLDRLTYREGETITYRRRDGSWLAVSGYRDGEIFYRKCNLARLGTRWHTIELQYPREAKARLDRIVTAMREILVLTALIADETRGPMMADPR
jgi:hypothetical protein